MFNINNLQQFTYIFGTYKGYVQKSVENLSIFSFGLACVVKDRVTLDPLDTPKGDIFHPFLLTVSGHGKSNGRLGLKLVAKEL